MKMSTADLPRLIVYTTPTCPDCLALKDWLIRRSIAFEERDLTDPHIATEAKSRTGMRIAPISIVGEAVYYGTFKSQKPELIRALGISVDD